MEKFLFPFLTAFLSASVLLAILVFLSKRWEIGVRSEEGRIHKHLSRFGGVALILAFFVAVLVNADLVHSRQLIGLMIGGLLILFAGVWDDIFRLSWKFQLGFQFSLSVLAFGFGMRIWTITNPFGAALALRPEQWIVPSLLVGTIWIVLVMNALNWVDGVDGLLGSVAFFAFLTIFFVSLKPEVNQPTVALLSAVFMGLTLAFLIFNFPPARILAGTSGAFFFGFSIAALSIFAGAKIATALLVLSLPVIDVFLVIFNRYRAKVPLVKGDQERHLHYKLLHAGFSERKIVILSALFTAAVAVLALNTTALGKVYVFLFVVILAVFGSEFFAAEKKWRTWTARNAALVLMIGGALVGSYMWKERSEISFGTSVVRIGDRVWNVEVAETPGARSKGLSDRDSLCGRCGMLFPFGDAGSRSFWMGGMRFPLDFAWIRDGKIVHIERNIPVNFGGTITPDEPADNVFEVNAHDLDGVSAGDAVMIK